MGEVWSEVHDEIHKHITAEGTLTQGPYGTYVWKVDQGGWLLPFDELRRTSRGYWWVHSGGKRVGRGESLPIALWNTFDEVNRDRLLEAERFLDWADIVPEILEGFWCTQAAGTKSNAYLFQEEDVNLLVIASSLAKKCRWGGHCDPAYSVAQHSVEVSLRLEGTGYELAGLLHDAAEVYLADLPRPTKILMHTFSVLERRILGKIFSKFKIPQAWSVSLPEKVKEADNRELLREARDLKMGDECYEAIWSRYQVEPVRQKIVPLSAPKAQLQFMRRFVEITGDYSQFPEVVL